MDFDNNIIQFKRRHCDAIETVYMENLNVVFKARLRFLLFRILSKPFIFIGYLILLFLTESYLLDALTFYVGKLL
jgi:hypothetical protein